MMPNRGPSILPRKHEVGFEWKNICVARHLSIATINLS